MIEWRHVGKAYGAATALHDVSLRIAPGELVTLVGPSGSGKSTLLRTLNRLVEPDTGQILFDGRDVRDGPPEALRRRMGYVIQSTGLFPHWTVARNVATVPRLLGWSVERINARVDALLVLLDLPRDVRDRYPHQLSGGQQQRVGIARALAADPEVLLMDEPFGALDPITRAALQDEIARVHATSGKTIVMVTHDIDEALRLGTRVVLLEAGRIVQHGPPAVLLARPATAAVRAFLGGSATALRELAQHRVSERMRGGDTAPGRPLAHDLRLSDALAVFLEAHVDRLPVTDADGRVVGVLHCADLLLPWA